MNWQGLVSGAEFDLQKLQLCVFVFPVSKGSNETRSQKCHLNFPALILMLVVNQDQIFPPHIWWLGAIPALPSRGELSRELREDAWAELGFGVWGCSGCLGPVSSL